MHICLQQVDNEPVISFALGGLTANQAAALASMMQHGTSGSASVRGGRYKSTSGGHWAKYEKQGGDCPGAGLRYLKHSDVT
jgi:pyridoxal biosynthesis lyase PdxS